MRMSAAAQRRCFPCPIFCVGSDSLLIEAAACWARFLPRAMMIVSPARAQPGRVPCRRGGAANHGDGTSPVTLEFMRIQPLAIVRRALRSFIREV